MEKLCPVTKKTMELKNWITETVIKHKGRSNVIPINNDLLGFCEGDYLTAALLTQLLYWNDKTKISGNWIAKSAKNWYDELNLSQKQVSRISKQLVNLKLIETKLKRFNGSPMTHYRLQETEFKKAFLEYLKTDISISTKGKNPIGRNVKMDFDQTDKSISTKGKNPIGRNVKMDFDQTDKSISTKGKNPIGRKVKMDFDKTGKSITEITTEINSKINSENKTERDFSPFEEIDFDDIKSSDVNYDIVPKEKSCGKKEKVVIQLPFESDTFHQTWNGWKSYLLEKLNREYSPFEEQAALMLLQNYDEQFSKGLITRAISSGWKSFHFEDTSQKYQNYLLNNNNNYEQSSKQFKNAVNERSEELWGNFAE